MYKSEQAAALGMLGEACQILGQSDVEFAVVGGWRPFLFNSTPIPHPGTFDVDILLRETTSLEAFKAAEKELLSRGYLRAPKNQFQAHRLLEVNGENLVYHVDFLHARYASDDLTMEWSRFQSIAGPGADVIFEHTEYRHEELPVVLPDGGEMTVRVPLATEVGILATKGRSAAVPKRTRDSFDIYLVVKQSRDRQHLVSRCRELASNAIFRIS